MCLCSLLPPSNHQAPRTQQSTHDLQGIIPVRLLIIASSCILRRDTFTSSVKIPYICTCAEISSETNDCEYSRFLHIPPVVYSGCWAGTWRRQLVVAFEAVASGKEGVCFGQVGGNVGQSGAVDRFSICGGSYLRHLWSKGGIGSPPPALRGPVRPKNVGLGCGCLASASEVNLKKVGAHGNACRVRVLPIPSIGRTTRGYIPI